MTRVFTVFLPKNNAHIQYYKRSSDINIWNRYTVRCRLEAANRKSPLTEDEDALCVLDYTEAIFLNL